MGLKAGTIKQFFDIDVPSIKSFYDNYSNDTAPCTVNEQGVLCVSFGDEITLPLTNSAKFITSNEANYCLVDNDGLLCWGENYFDGSGYRATPIY